MSPIGFPVKLQAYTAPLGNCGLSGTPSLTGLGGKKCSISVHSVDNDKVGLSPPLLAEAQFVVCVIRALFSMGEEKESGRRQLLLHHFTLFPFPPENKGR